MISDSYTAKILRKLCNASDTSLLFKVLRAISEWYSQSHVHIVFMQLLNVDYSSMLARNRKLFSPVFKPFKALLRIYTEMYEQGYIKKLVEYISKQFRYLFFILTSVILVCSASGYFLTRLASQKTDTESAIFAIILLSAGVLLFLMNKQLRKWTMGSRVLRGLISNQVNGSLMSVENKTQYNVFLLLTTAFFGLLLGVTGAIAGIPAALGMFVLIFGIFIIMLDIQKVVYLTGVFIILDFIARNISLSDQLSGYWDEFLIIFCFVLFIIKLIIATDKPLFRLTPLDLPIIVFIFSQVFVLLVNTEDLKIGLEGIRAVVEYILFYFVITQLLKTDKGAIRLICVFAGTGVILGLHGIYQFVAKVPIPKEWLDITESTDITRAFSIAGNPNALASILVMVIPICLALFLIVDNKKLKILCMLALTITIICLVFTGTRSAWIGYLIALFIMIRVKSKKIFAPAVLSVIVALIITTFLLPTIGARISYLVSEEYKSSSVKAGRIFRWDKSFDLFINYPFTGVGLGRFGGAVAANNGIKDTFYVDNYYLKTSVESGLVGLLGFIYMISGTILWILRGIYLLKRKGDLVWTIIGGGILAALIGVLIHALFENVFEVPSTTVYFWMLAGVFMYYVYGRNQQAEQPSGVQELRQAIQLNDSLELQSQELRQVEQPSEVQELQQVDLPSGVQEIGKPYS